ncbi:LPS export ABC transporter periplasmic protein LptC [Sphingomonas abietis]|uniref:LPS export ABC transporter periplasmic protein LptC n=1 Tax=Sphingomonas abietis TaxID=3012344 RepID=A0ABY7NML1_9SPHN|nr:LPS export ABC transporter periplasmic protein LptC [Sphingomonas abietis]WBO22750.1 LPS export ABC transporter periplasmic protein LptC [Sphingomonas abietis]
MPEPLAGTLSDIGLVERRKRRAWAMPGSSHDRIIAVARITLPASVLVLVLALGFAPLTSGRDISFVLSKDRVAVAKERMRVSQALYRGEDSKGQPFSLTALSAVQQTSADPVVKLNTLAAKIALQGGPATIVAPTGTYNMDNQKVGLNGPVTFHSADGYRLDTHDVDLDMQTRKLASRNPVTGTMPLGNFSADQLQADLDSHVVVLNGHARLHITQRNGTSPK